MHVSKLSDMCEGKSGRKEEVGEGPSCEKRPREEARDRQVTALGWRWGGACETHTVLLLPGH